MKTTRVLGMKLDSDMSALATGNPALEWYWNLGFVSPVISDGSFSCLLNIELIYYAKLFSPLDVAQS